MCVCSNSRVRVYSLAHSLDNACVRAYMCVCVLSEVTSAAAASAAALAAAQAAVAVAVSSAR